MTRIRLTRVLVVTALVVATLPRGATAAPGRLTPAMVEHEMYAGRSRTVRYDLVLPAEPPRPADLYLLVDTGPATRPYLPALRSGLAAALDPLAERGVRVGVGEFRTTSAADWPRGLTYRALRRVGPVGASLVSALDGLGRDEPVPAPLPGSPAHPVALAEAVTGDGHQPYVTPGQDAGFAPGARKVVVVVSAAAFAADPTQPSRADAIAALRAAGAEVFGLALHGDALADLTAVAAGTGSLADTAVDCGAGRVAAGRPTACAAAPRAIGGALTGMLYERRRARVTVAVTGSGYRAPRPAAWWVDLSVPSRQTFRLDVVCAAGDGGRTHQITLTVSAAGRTVARARVLVRCLRR